MLVVSARRIVVTALFTATIPHIKSRRKNVVIKMEKRKSPASSPTLVIIFGYLIIILVGAILLTMPFSSRSGEFTPFIDSMFTSTSATCVTGLIVFDTYTYWSTAGQAIILALIQIGGIGFMTLAISALILTGKRIGLRERFMMQESVNAPMLGGIIRMTRFIFITAIAIELIGAALLSPVMCSRYGIGKGIYFSIFHSISAFCNGGFDLMGGTSGKFSSLTSFGNNIYVNIIIMLLITLGGIGFLVWADIAQNKWHISRYKLHTKLVLFTSAILIIIPSAMIFVFELNNPLTSGNGVLSAIFQSVTTRTAGFNTIDLTSMTDASIAIMIPLMLIGGSTGSTAGGIKTTTVALLYLSIASVMKKRKSIEVFRRRISDETLRDACCVTVLYVLIFIISGAVISALEKIPLKEAFFECGSAVGTVGLTLGITPGLSDISHVILMLLMFFGRIGGLTIIFAVSEIYEISNSQLPLEKVAIG